MDGWEEVKGGEEQEQEEGIKSGYQTGWCHNLVDGDKGYSH